MIDIRNGELADLWPDETSPEFKSISYALHMAIIRMLEKAAGVGSSCDIDHLQNPRWTTWPWRCEPCTTTRAQTSKQSAQS